MKAGTKKKQSDDVRAPSARRDRGLTRVIVWLSEDDMAKFERLRRELKKGAETSWDTSNARVVRLALERATS